MRHDEVDFGGFDGSDFSKGAPVPKIVAWCFVNALPVRQAWMSFMSVKLFLLRLFGATIGKGCVVKSNVVVKSPWNLVVGDNCWIGEDVWIDNIDKVVVEDDVCLSQGAMLLTGNHDYSVRTMPYRSAPIRLCRGAWIGAKAVVCPGVVAGRDAILTVGSVATKDMAPLRDISRQPGCEGATPQVSAMTASPFLCCANRKFANFVQLLRLVLRARAF